MEIKNNPIRPEREFKPDFDIYTKPLIPYLSKSHLDIGCGQGEITSYFLILKPDINITGFDPNQTSIETAKKYFNSLNNLSFTSNKEDLTNKKFNSSSAIFVYHEAGKEIFKTASESLTPGSFFTIVDYDIKDIGLLKFKELFNSTGELKEVAELGWDKACLLHTKRGLKQCLESAEDHGFKTIKSEKLNDKYFFWVGQKI